MIKSIKKENKKGIKNAIIFYQDPDTGKNKRIIIGESESIMDFFIENSQKIMKDWPSVRKALNEDGHISSGGDTSRTEASDGLHSVNISYEIFEEDIKKDKSV